MKHLAWILLILSGLANACVGAGCSPPLVADQCNANPPTANCQVGALCFNSAATAGQNIYECASVNTWTQQLNSGGGGGGSPAGSTGDIQTNGGSGNFGAFTPGTGVVTALGVNVGSAGAPVVFNGAGGTPSSITLTNAGGTASSLTAGTASAVAVGGITGMGTGAGTWLATPSGANLASALTSALPAAKGGTGLTSLGTGVATFLGTPSAVNFESMITTPVTPAAGGTGVANNDSSTLTISGNYGTTLTVTGATSITLPTSGTVLSTATAPTFSAKATNGGLYWDATASPGNVANFVYGTSVMTALGVNIGTAGAVLVKGTSVCADLASSGTGCTATIANYGALATANNWTAPQSGSIKTLTISTTTYTPDSSAQNYLISAISHTTCAAAACTLANFSTPVAGQSGVIEILQDSTGGGSIGTWGTYYLAAGGTSTLTQSSAPNALDFIPYYVIDSTHILLGAVIKNATH